MLYYFFVKMVVSKIFQFSLGNNMSENKKKINIGFDIGVASVGWSLIDEDHNY